MENTNAKYVSQKISKIRWRPVSASSLQQPDIFVSGSWDNEVGKLSIRLISALVNNYKLQFRTCYHTYWQLKTVVSWNWFLILLKCSLTGVRFSVTAKFHQGVSCCLQLFMDLLVTNWACMIVQTHRIRQDETRMQNLIYCVLKRRNKVVRKMTQQHIYTIQVILCNIKIRLFRMEIKDVFK